MEGAIHMVDVDGIWGWIYHRLVPTYVVRYSCNFIFGIYSCASRRYARCHFYFVLVHDVLVIKCIRIHSFLFMFIMLTKYVSFFVFLWLYQKMDLGPCPKVHSLQLRKEYPYCFICKACFACCSTFSFYSLKHIYVLTNGLSTSTRSTAFNIIWGLSRERFFFYLGWGGVLRTWLNSLPLFVRPATVWVVWLFFFFFLYGPTLLWYSCLSSTLAGIVINRITLKAIHLNFILSAGCSWLPAKWVLLLASLLCMTSIGQCEIPMEGGFSITHLWWVSPLYELFGLLQG